MMSRCYFFRPNGVPVLTVRRTAAIGDAIMATVVAEKLSRAGAEVVFQTALPIQPVIRRCPWVSRVDNPVGAHGYHGREINLDGARESEKVNRARHFSDTFLTVANQQLVSQRLNLGPALNCRPVLIVRDNERAAVQAQLAAHPRPWIFICPRSNSFAVRQVSDGVWQAASGVSEDDVLARHTPGPGRHRRFALPQRGHAAAAALRSGLLVTVDTGPMHIAAALGTPLVVILQSLSPEMHLSDQRDWVMIAPKLDCLHCMERICPKNRHLPPCQNIDPNLVASAVNARVSGLEDGQVSAVIATYRAPAHRLNRVLELILPEVAEVVVTRALDAQLPAGAMQDRKIRYVVKQQRNIGFGRNVNYGVRQTFHEWLLIINDNCYLNHGAVEAMLNRLNPTRGF